MLAEGAFLLRGWKCHLLLVQTVFPGPFMFRFLTRRGPERASFYPHVLEGLLGEVGFTSLCKELAWHARRDLWLRDPGTVRDARGGKGRGSSLQTWLGGGGGRQGPPGLDLWLQTCSGRGLPLCPHQPQDGRALPGAHRELGARGRVPRTQSVPRMAWPLSEVEGGVR